MILGGVTDPDTLERLSLLCGEIRLRTHSRTRDDYGRHGHNVAYEPARVLPPELLRTLPEWRALVVRGNLSPVVVRLRMAWHRQDHRHARRRAGTPQQLQPTAAADAIAPRQAKLPTGNGLIPRRAANGRHRSGQSELQPTAADDESGSELDAPWPPTAPHWTPPPDAPPPGDNHHPPRPRRPWDPPTEPRNRP